MALPTKVSGSAITPNSSQADATAAAAAPTAGSVSISSSDADMAQAFRDLARGEQTALALESNLTSLERKLDDYLAIFEEAERQRVHAVDEKKTPGDSDGKKS